MGAPGTELPIAPLVATRPAGNTERVQLAVQETLKTSAVHCAMPVSVAIEVVRALLTATPPRAGAHEISLLGGASRCRALFQRTQRMRYRSRSWARFEFL